MSSSPLAGLRILDLTMYLPGPYASYLFADLGADVIQIEPPGGDLGRHVEPRLGDDSALHRWVARGKRSIELDLKSRDGKEAFWRLLDGADVVMEGFTPGAADRLGVGYVDCAAVKPEIVYCSISGPGNAVTASVGPGHDINYLARSGFLSQATDADHAPVPVGPAVADLSAGLHAAVGILAAILHRNATGEGQFIDIGLMGAALAMTAPQLIKYLVPEPLTPDRDHNLGVDPAYRVYGTADHRFVAIGAFEQKFWVRLCDLLRRPDLVTSRDSDPASACSQLEVIFASESRDHWTALLEDAGVCYAQVNALDEVAADPLVTAREDLERQPDGHLRLVSPIRMAKAPIGETQSVRGKTMGVTNLAWVPR